MVLDRRKGMMGCEDERAPVNDLDCIGNWKVSSSEIEALCLQNAIDSISLCRHITADQSSRDDDVDKYQTHIRNIGNTRVARSHCSNSP